MRRVLLCLLLLAVVPLALGPRASHAQQTPPDLVNAEAEAVFDQALDVFEQGEYRIAGRRFQEVARGFPLHVKTTAAFLMAGKAYYRAGEYDDAVEVLEELRERFPQSRYTDEARRVIGFAEELREATARAKQVHNIGIVLPLNDDNAALSQALFNGIRLAVEGYNDAPGQERALRMIFRDSGNSPQRARAAVDDLADEVDVIIGPLFTDEVHAAAAAAERAGVPLVVPLDASDGVTDGRSHVFQANPTFTMRGRQMGAFAVRNLRLGTLGVVAEFDNPASERMAEGFQEEVERQGEEVTYFQLLRDESGWYSLPETVGADTLDGIEALYMPITGRKSETYAGAALAGLGRMGVNLRVLGNEAWHELSVKTQASTFATTYANPFMLDATRPAVQDFVRRYRALAGSAPSARDERLVYTGYDVAGFVAEQLGTGRPLRDAVRAAEPYQGLAIRLDFREGNVNQGMHYLRYRSGQLEQIW